LPGLADAAKVVLEAGPDRGGNSDYHDHPDDPSQEDRLPVVVAPRPGSGRAGWCGRGGLWWSDARLLQV
jgi:hypothetical protein